MSDFDINYLMNIASFLYFICYIPEAYANIRNKNANGYNIPEKVILLCGTCFALSFAILTENKALIINYAPLMSLDFIMLVIRIYYAYFYNKKPLELVMESDCEIMESTPNPIHNVDSLSSFDSDI